MIKDEIKNIKNSPGDLKKFGITVGSVLVIISIILYYFNYASYYYLLSPGLLLIALALAVPTLLKPLNKAWMTIAILLGWFMTRVILSTLFYLVITPIGLASKLAGKDFLALKKSNTNSYWNMREKRTADQQEYERQF